MPYEIPEDPRRRLREVRDLLAASLETARGLTSERDLLIRHVLNEGDSLRKVAIDSGLTKSRIDQIASSDWTLIDDD